MFNSKPCSWRRFSADLVGHRSESGPIALFWIERNSRSLAAWPRGYTEALSGLLVALSYAATRAIFVGALDVEFDATGLEYFWQFVDSEELRTNLIESVFYQHTQPPLYNLYLGAGLHTDDPTAFFRWTGYGFGLALHLAVFGSLRRLGARRWLAAAVSIAVALSPASILYETWLFYTYPVASLLAVAAYWLHRGISRGGGGSAWTAFVLLAAVVLTRSLFHLAWLAWAAGLVLWLAPRRRAWVVPILVALCIAGSLYLKNYVVFDRFVASTWLGPSLSKMTTQEASDRMKQAWAARGMGTPLLRHNVGFQALDYYPSEYRRWPGGLPRVAVLSETTRASGNPNMNHAAYLRIGDDLLADALLVMRESPKTYWESVGRAWMIYFLPTHDYSFLAHRRRALRPVERVYEFAVGSPEFTWSWGEPLPSLELRACLGWMVGLPLLLAGCVWAAIRRRGAPRVVLLFCVGTVIWVALVGNFLEVGENNRFRFLTAPLVAILCGFVLEHGLRWVLRSWTTLCVLRSAGAALKSGTAERGKER